jgi:signal transduction histidine kinase
VQSVALAHGGEVLVESGEEGSSVSLCLPLGAATENHNV